MKTTPTFRKFSYVAVALLLLGSCSKKSEAPDNLAAFRTDASQAQKLDVSSIKSDMVLEDRVSGVDYIISQNVSVLANLTIKPGVTIMFGDGAGLTVSEQGSITATGTGKDVIYFTSQSGKRGAWKGLTIANTNSKNTLTYCKIEHGGSFNEYGSGNVIIGTGATLGQAEISNSEITASGTDGIQVAPGSKIINFTGNNIHTNTACPVSINIGDAAALESSNTFAGNGKEFIKLTGGLNGTSVSKAITLNRLNEPFLLSGSITAVNKFSIASGNHIYMDSDAQLVIDGTKGGGSINAVGTADQPIAITAPYGGSKVWNKISLVASNSANNVLEYCTISGGGQDATEGMINVVSNEGGSSKIAIHNCNITNSGASGIYIEGVATQYNTDILTANQFSNNTNGNVTVK